MSMREWRCTWTQCPHVQHTRQVTFVLAEDEDGARAVLRDHIERHQGVEWFTIHTVEPYTRPLGRVSD
jgi:hypothetical protein